MQKHQSLRAALVAVLPELEREKDRLAVWIDQGSIAARLGTRDANGNTGFEYRYRVNVILLDFAKDPAIVFASLIDWLRTNQPELLLNPETLKTAIDFRVDVLDDRKVDIEIHTELSEAVEIDGLGNITYRAEPAIAQSSVDGLIDVPLGATLGTVSVNGEDLP